MNVTIGKKLQNLRRQSGFSQEHIANRLHISQSAYARIENGESHSWANHISQLCEIFEITPEELVNNDSVVINHNQQGGGGYIQINQLSEKLIEQYETRLKEKDEIIKDLRERR